VVQLSARPDVHEVIETNAATPAALEQILDEAADAGKVLVGIWPRGKKAWLVFRRA
jgi:hypothetical protein